MSWMTSSSTRFHRLSSSEIVVELDVLPGQPVDLHGAGDFR
jgi:hypothetical protein